LVANLDVGPREAVQEFAIGPHLAPLDRDPAARGLAADLGRDRLSTPVRAHTPRPPALGAFGGVGRSPWGAACSTRADTRRRRLLRPRRRRSLERRADPSPVLPEIAGRGPPAAARAGGPADDAIAGHGAPLAVTIALALAGARPRGRGPGPGRRAALRLPARGRRPRGDQEGDRGQPAGGRPLEEGAEADQRGRAGEPVPGVSPRALQAMIG